MQRRINLLVGAISVLHDGPVRRVGRNPVSDSHHRIAGLVHRLPGADTHAGKDGRAIRSPFLSFDDLHFATVYVCLNLSPQR